MFGGSTELGIEVLPCVLRAAACKYGEQYRCVTPNALR
jgi:hypothetical protein